MSSYATSKAALEGFAKSAAVELAKEKIRVNCVAPGFVKSSYADDFKLKLKDLYNWTIGRTPVKRWGNCEEIAYLVQVLASKENSFMTGSTVNCDGGWAAS